jgi:hypothetical protein
MTLYHHHTSCGSRFELPVVFQDSERLQFGCLGHFILLHLLSRFPFYAYLVYQSGYEGNDVRVKRLAGAAMSPGLMTGLVLVALIVVSVNLRPAITTVAGVMNQVPGVFGLDPALLPLLGTLPVLAFGISGPIGPWLARRWGTGRAVAVALLVLAGALIVRATVPALLLAGHVPGWHGDHDRECPGTPDRQSKPRHRLVDRVVHHGFRPRSSAWCRTWSSHSRRPSAATFHRHWPCGRYRRYWALF